MLVPGHFEHHLLESLRLLPAKVLDLQGILLKVEKPDTAKAGREDKLPGPVDQGILNVEALGPLHLGPKGDRLWIDGLANMGKQIPALQTRLWRQASQGEDGGKDIQHAHRLGNLPGLVLRQIHEQGHPDQGIIEAFSGTPAATGKETPATVPNQKQGDTFGVGTGLYGIEKPAKVMICKSYLAIVQVGTPGAKGFEAPMPDMLVLGITVMNHEKELSARGRGGFQDPNSPVRDFTG